MTGMAVDHRSTRELEDALDQVRAAPADAGSLELIVARPAPGERVALTEAVLDLTVGLVGDCWLERGSRTGPDGAAHPDRQLTLMNDRFAALVAGDPDRRALAGDQLYVDLDLSEENLPAGSRLAIGSAVVEIAAAPHTGCAKFVERFGRDAGRFVNTGIGGELRLRGVNAFVVEGGAIATGDPVRKITS